jgi:hypothetical protein
MTTYRLPGEVDEAIVIWILLRFAGARSSSWKSGISAQWSTTLVTGKIEKAKAEKQRGLRLMGIESSCLGACRANQPPTEILPQPGTEHPPTRKIGHKKSAARHAAGGPPMACSRSSLARHPAGRHRGGFRGFTAPFAKS